jgi:HlyD family secretion protein
MTRFKKYFLPALGALLLVMFAVNVVRYLLAPSPERVRAQDREVGARVVAGTDDADPLPSGRWVGGNAIVEPRDRETKVAAAVPGRIARIAVTEGQRVEAGAVLVELESVVEAAAVAVADAEIAAAQAELSRLTRGSRSEDVDAANAEAEAALARASLATSVLSRTQAASTSGGLSADEVERAERQAQADTATATLADARRRAVVSGPRREEIAAARARALAARARRDQAVAQLDRLIVRAPIAGEVLQVKYRAGEYVAPGQADPLVVLGDTSTLHVRMDVDERDFAHVRLGSNVLVRAIAFPGRDFRGRVIEVGRRMGRKNVRTDDPTERNDTKVLEVVIALEQPSGLVVGQRVDELRGRGMSRLGVAVIVGVLVSCTSPRPGSGGPAPIGSAAPVAKAAPDASRGARCLPQLERHPPGLRSPPEGCPGQGGRVFGTRTSGRNRSPRRCSGPSVIPSGPAAAPSPTIASTSASSSTRGPRVISGKGTPRGPTLGDYRFVPRTAALAHVDAALKDLEGAGADDGLTGLVARLRATRKTLVEGLR